MKSNVAQITIKSADKMVAITSADGHSERHPDQEPGIDVIVKLHDGTKYFASFFLYEKLIKEMHRPSSRYSPSNQKYFWRKNMVMVNDFKADTIEEIIHDLIDEGDFLQAFERLDKE